MCKSYIFPFSLIFISCWTDQASSLHVEGILGAQKAKADVFTYQVAVEGRKNYSNDYIPICGGGIISENLILCAAHCFIDEYGNFDQLSYSVTVGTINLKNPANKRIEVDRIYVLRYDSETSVNDIAILKLKNSLRIIISLKWSILKLPKLDELLAEKTAIVAGYGYTWIEVEYDNVAQKEIFIDGGTDLLLRFAEVEILSDADCLADCEGIITNEHLCAKMKPTVPSKPRGTCRMDSGGPLVINGDTVVGIVMRSSFECDEIRNGASFYARVSGYLSFINGVKEGRLKRGTLVHRNLPHVKKSPLY